ncbi:MAG: nucleotidyltransferase family protein [Nitrospiraceae bacterium]|nr:nucleotidyltransferase family protein [Nitrospiraceae bacterium]
MSLPVAILAGGLATRLRPMTEQIPKALIEVAGRPFIFRQLNYLKGQGVTRVVLCTGYLGEQIEAVVGNGRSMGLDVSYSSDGPVLLGTGGTLIKALPLLDRYFFVLYGDSFLPCDFRKVQAAFESGGNPALMTVLKNGNRWDKSNVLFREGKLVEYDKSFPKPEMEHIDYGLGILSAEVFMEYPPGQPLDLADVYHRLSLAGLLSGVEVNERFYEIGSHSGLMETEQYFLAQET